MSYDEMELDMIGDQKTAMFVIISDTDDTFNFVVAIMYTQAEIWKNTPTARKRPRPYKNGTPKIWEIGTAKIYSTIQRADLSNKLCSM